LAKLFWMLELSLIVIGLLVGFTVGRWPVVLLALVLGVWIGVSTDVELPHWFLGVGYALIFGAALASGVWARRRGAARRAP